MLSRRMKLILCAALMWTTAVFAQLPKVEASTPIADLPENLTNTSMVKQKIAIRAEGLTLDGPSSLFEARKVTTLIFKDAGLEASWIDCPFSEADCTDEGAHPQFRVRAVLPALERELDPKGEVLGFAMPCAKSAKMCLVYVFYSRISARALDHCVSPGLILGHVIAHEIGHTLLGQNAHTLWGIMQARLPIGDMGRILYFNRDETERLRTELWVRSRSIAAYKPQ